MSTTITQIIGIDIPESVDTELFNMMTITTTYMEDIATIKSEPSPTNAKARVFNTGQKTGFHQVK